MRVANLKDRLGLMTSDGRFLDIERASGGIFSSDPQAVFERWEELRQWAAGTAFDDAEPISWFDLGSPVPRPAQVFAIGLNYRDHAAEGGHEIPAEPMVFTKFVSSLVGAHADIGLPPGHVDWEVELVVVIGRGGRMIDEGSAWDRVAGVTLGQDISERVTQNSISPPQFGLAKSYEGFSPVGPAVVSLDEIASPGDLEIGCRLNGEVVQHSRTGNMIFSIPRLVAKLSAIVELRPGDLIFTGTPSGVGARRTPPRFLRDGDELTSWCTGVGEMSHRFVEKRAS